MSESSQGLPSQEELLAGIDYEIAEVSGSQQNLILPLLAYAQLFSRDHLVVYSHEGGPAGFELEKFTHIAYRRLGFVDVASGDAVYANPARYTFVFPSAKSAIYFVEDVVRNCVLGGWHDEAFAPLAPDLARHRLLECEEKGFLRVFAAPEACLLPLIILDPSQDHRRRGFLTLKRTIGREAPPEDEGEIPELSPEEEAFEIAKVLTAYPLLEPYCGLVSRQVLDRLCKGNYPGGQRISITDVLAAIAP